MMKAVEEIEVEVDAACAKQRKAQAGEVYRIFPHLYIKIKSISFNFGTITNLCNCNKVLYV